MRVRHAAILVLCLCLPSISRASTIRETAVTTPSSDPTAITAGPDGRVWFVERLGNKVGALAQDGTITEFPIPTGGSQPAGIVAAPPSETEPAGLWFTEQAAGKVASINAETAELLEFPTLTASSPTSITADTSSTNGGIW